MDKKNERIGLAKQSTAEVVSVQVATSEVEGYPDSAEERGWDPYEVWLTRVRKARPVAVKPEEQKLLSARSTSLFVPGIATKAKNSFTDTAVALARAVRSRLLPFK